MNALITGGCGFVGSNLAAYLLERGHTVTAFDNLARHGASANLAWLRSFDKGEFAFLHGDIRNLSDVDLAIRTLKPDVIFHLAGQVP
jgi:CDP-paratose 2-epimerase